MAYILQKLQKRMNKKGQTVEAIGGILMVIVLVVGVFGSYQIISENRYVGDVTSKEYYDLKTCEIKQIDQSSLIIFQNQEDAIKNGYKPSKCINK